jgi:uncharacterized protein YacL
MLQNLLRAFLVLALLAVGMSYVETGELLPEFRAVLIIGALIVCVIVISIDLVIPRKSLQALSGLFFGLTVGLLITYGLSLVLSLLVSAFMPSLGTMPVYRTQITEVKDSSGNIRLDEKGQPLIRETKVLVGERDHPVVAATKVTLGIICCYFCVSFIMQTKDDIRFVIPYVEFAKQVKGHRPLILDTSVIIDGRIADICDTGLIDQTLVVPRFVLIELQAIADSGDKLKRARGRRGLDVLSKLQGNAHIDIQVLDTRSARVEAAESVDLKLLAVAQDLNGRLATNDFNLSKIAKLRDVVVININEVANAVKPVFLPGEPMVVKIIKAGEEPGQGIGYLDDGTMVVVDQGRGKIGEIVNIAVTSVLQTSAGRMIFGRMESTGPNNRRKV